MQSDKPETAAELRVLYNEDRGPGGEELLYRALAALEAWERQAEAATLDRRLLIRQWFSAMTCDACREVRQKRLEAAFKAIDAARNAGRPARAALEEKS